MVSSNDVQHLFIQAVISRRILSQKLAAKLLEKCVDAVKAADETLDVEYRHDREFWDEWVTKVNTVLNPLDLEFARMADGSTAKEMYALVNRKGDEVAQLATEYSPNEIAYFKGILEQIMLAPHESFCISSLAALREASHLKSHMTKVQAEAVLGSLVARGWLLRSKKGRYSLSTRTLLELESYLRSTYADEVIECTICSELITSGYACSVQACKVRLHAHCYNRWRRGNQACPSCKTAWAAGEDKMGKVGEAAFRDGQDRSRKVRRSGSDDSDADEDEDADEEGASHSQSQGPSQSQSQSQDASQSQAGPSQTQTQRNGKTKVKAEKVKVEGKGKGKKKAVRVEDSEDEDDADGMAMDEQDDTPPPRTQKRKGRR